MTDPPLPPPTRPSPGNAAGRPKKNDRALFVMLFILALAAGSWFLAKKLVAMSRIQDCVMAGRKNCVQVDDPNPR